MENVFKLFVHLLPFSPSSFHLLESVRKWECFSSFLFFSHCIKHRVSSQWADESLVNNYKPFPQLFIKPSNKLPNDNVRPSKTWWPHLHMISFPQCKWFYGWDLSLLDITWLQLRPIVMFCFLLSYCFHLLNFMSSITEVCDTPMDLWLRKLSCLFRLYHEKEEIFSPSKKLK